MRYNLHSYWGKHLIQIVLSSAGAIHTDFRFDKEGAHAYLPNGWSSKHCTEAHING